MTGEFEDIFQRMRQRAKEKVRVHKPGSWGIKKEFCCRGHVRNQETVNKWGGCRLCQKMRNRKGIPR